MGRKGGRWGVGGEGEGGRKGGEAKKGGGWLYDIVRNLSVSDSEISDCSFGLF